MQLWVNWASFIPTSGHTDHDLKVCRAKKMFVLVIIFFCLFVLTCGRLLLVVFPCVKATAKARRGFLLWSSVHGIEIGRYEWRQCERVSMIGNPRTALFCLRVTSVTRLGNFWKFLSTNMLSKVSIKIVDFWAILIKINYYKKLSILFRQFLETFGQLFNPNIWSY